MKLSDVLAKEHIIINLYGMNKFEVLEKMVKVTKSSAKVVDEVDLLEKVITREKIKSTGIGGGIGIPHAQTLGVTDFIACLGISQDGIDFNALDEKPVHLVFLIATKERTNNIYLELLSSIARLFVDETFKQKIIKSKSPDEIMQLISEKEEEN
ncbi:putative nitrogen regulatory bacterial protein IIA [Candidatus Kuenenia stuttgartiensis]|uniref:Putative nitrogen regulatory bacterial protein IIA n=1 Tax=Kuenenia stuttgartiensis TaxID=174633 RepID=A0A6G7GPV9_KUEST|nr:MULTISPECIES: PTS sugar transporter subunit IIA [Kuenenia]MBE7546967.1 PTS sugar transporter subunit IIA [Planctomycetia bacterium]MBW7942199.1 PTS sugar transporter subunit IIA [Candidatus Kuenenia stuttgartiensis]MBZ0191911.1 PTS sugar transporter subunit IIA [Candidatus Kuenenia stuttgartiensis]MCF6151403.1 PTS sugar transporter subunit IIA [Candidatus Kuenenia stuttgartiensis]MCL4726260.1 PTS sugar transporter subunit IIA [Candidatus Kuenenia stuttgartiensis]